MGGKGTGGVEAQEGVEVGEQGVDAVEGRAAVAVAERKVVALLRDELAEDGEVLRGGFALEAAHGVEIVGGGEGAEAVAEGVGDGFDGGGIGRPFAGGAAEDVTGVGDFTGDEGAGKGGAGGGVVGAAVLDAAEEDVARGRADDIGEVAAVLGEERERDAGIGAGSEEERAAEDVAEAHDAAEVEEREAQTDFLFDLDDDGLALFAEVGALGRDVEGVEETAHRGGRTFSRRRQR